MVLHHIIPASARNSILGKQKLVYEHLTSFLIDSLTIWKLFTIFTIFAVLDKVFEPFLAESAIFLFLL